MNKGVCRLLQTFDKNENICCGVNGLWIGFHFILRANNRSSKNDTLKY